MKDIQLHRTLHLKVSEYFCLPRKYFHRQIMSNHCSALSSSFASLHTRVIDYEIVKMAALEISYSFDTPFSLISISNTIGGFNSPFVHGYFGDAALINVVHPFVETL